MFVACHILRLQSETRFTALVLLHRYVRAKMTQSDNIATTTANTLTDSGLEDLAWVGAACIFLACKVEEEHRRLRDVINMVHMVFSPPDDNNCQTDGSSVVDMCQPIDGNNINNNINKNVVIQINSIPPNLNEEYWKSKKRIVETEQAVLRWLGFDVSVSHPHRAVILIWESTSWNKQNDDKQVLAIACRRLNDALFWPPALQHAAIELACAAIELALDEVLERNNERVGGTGTEIGGDASTTKATDRQSLVNEILIQFQLTNEALKLCKDHLIQATSYLEKQTGIE
jgi:hypothetical protein